MSQAIIVKSGGGGITSDDVTATKNQVLQGVTALTSDSDDEAIEGTIQVVDTAQDNYSKTRTTEFGLLKDRNIFYMNLPQRSAFYTRDDNKPHVEIVADAFGDATQYQLLEGSTATSKNGVKFNGTFPKTSDIDSRNEFWLFKNYNGKDVYVTRIPESAYVKYYDQGGSQGWDPWVRISRELVKAGVNYHPEKTLDDTVTCDERGQIPIRQNASMTTELVNVHWENPKKFGFRFPQGYYPQLGQYQPVVLVSYQDLANAIGIRADKMTNDTNILGIQGNLPYWVCYTGDVISALNNEGFAWDDTYAGRGRGIVVKIPNSHVIAGANYVFLPSPNLLAENIRENVNINGVTGTLPDYRVGRPVFENATFNTIYVGGVANKDFQEAGIYRDRTSSASNYSRYAGGTTINVSAGSNFHLWSSGQYVGFVIDRAILFTFFRWLKITYKLDVRMNTGSYNRRAGVDVYVHLYDAANRSSLIGGMHKMHSSAENAGSTYNGDTYEMIIDTSSINKDAFVALCASAYSDYNMSSAIGSVTFTKIELIN
uniref:Uncharacterized protein n=1 Tax=Myoviridae sp. ctQdF5 TaxID=2825101 RepID=A0A8S5U2V1_9CAUD|nr:MAG TPA: hypothetical protein [Myoviridae sp. ctQdF5]